MSTSALLKQQIDRGYPVVTHGKGVFLFDTRGRRYLDGSGGAMTASIGHGVEEIAEAVQAQMARVAFTYRTQFTNQPAEDLAQHLTTMAPGDLDFAFFVSSGSEATEYAMRAAVGYWQRRSRPDKVKILGRHTSYHGMTMGALSMSGHAARRGDYGSLLHPFPVTAPVHAYRYADQDEDDAAYAARAAADFERAITEADPATVAAVIVEPIVGAAGGVLVPPVGYLALLRQVCDRMDVLLIMDEVITGVGRTGEWFMSTSEQLVPDILVAGKGMSGGYAPVAAALLRSPIVEVLELGDGVAPFGHTFSGNPLGAATCLAVLDYMDKVDVLANTRARGLQLETGLRDLAARFPFVVDVRGRGLLWGFEFAVGGENSTPPAPEHNAAGAFADECFARGLIVYPAGIAPLNNATLLSPPLTISEDEVDLMLTTLGSALRGMAQRQFMRPTDGGRRARNDLNV